MCWVGTCWLPLASLFRLLLRIALLPARIAAAELRCWYVLAAAGAAVPVVVAHATGMCCCRRYVLLVRCVAAAGVIVPVVVAHAAVTGEAALTKKRTKINRQSSLFTKKPG
jgi:hypothetical protein